MFRKLGFIFLFLLIWINSCFAFTKEEIISTLKQNIKDKLNVIKEYNIVDLNITVKNSEILNKINNNAKKFFCVIETKKLWGFLIVPINFYNEQDKLVDKLRLLVEVKAFANLVSAKRNLKAREIVKEEDLQLSCDEINDKPNNIITNINEAIGRETKYDITRGNFLLKSMIQEVPLIRKGDKISIIFLNNGIKLELEGTALEDGYYSKTIQIKRKDVFKIFKGEVIGSKKVLVLDSFN